MDGLFNFPKAVEAKGSGKRCARLEKGTTAALVGLGFSSVQVVRMNSVRGCKVDVYKRRVVLLE